MPKIGRTPSWWTVAFLIAFTYSLLWASRTLINEAKVFTELGLPETSGVLLGISSAVLRVATVLMLAGFVIGVHGLIRTIIEIKRPPEEGLTVNLNEAVEAIQRLKNEAEGSNKLLIDKRAELSHIQELIGLTEPQVVAIERRFRTRFNTVAAIVGVVLSLVGLVLTLLA